MTPEPNSTLLVYDQNFNGLGETIEAFNKSYEDERITRSKGKEIFTFQVLSTSAIYRHLKVENIVEFGGRWFRIKYLEDDDSIKGLTTFTCYALWYELAEGMPTSLNIAVSNLHAVATQILQPFGKWTKLVIPTALQSTSVRGVTLKENSALYQLRYLAKQYELELTFGYEVVIENELRYVKTVVFLQQYAENKLDFPLIVEDNLRHISKTEDSRNLVTAYKLTGKSENDEEEFTFASINNGNPYLVDTSWFNRLGVKPRIIPKSKQDDRFIVKQNMLDAARQFLDIYAKPLITYEAGAILYSVIPDLHDSQLVIDDTYDILEWRRVSSRQLNYDDLTSSTIIFDDPRQNLMDLLNDDGDGALSYQENETARPIIRFADDVLGTNMNDTSGKYIGVITTKKPVEQLTPDDFTWVSIEGPPGRDGVDGVDGVDGIAGRDGVGIVATDITYYISTSGITTPTTGWSSSVPTLIKGRYLWTRTIWTYSDGQRETGYQVTYIGQDGNNAKDGLPGKDGVGITSTAITYARSTSGTSAPSTGWTSEVPAVPPGQFLWTKTIWNYSDSTSETGYSVAKIGDTGPKGEDGKTPYVHWAYSDNADGTGLTLTDTGQRYIGNYSDYTQADSTDKTKYRWADRWAKIEGNGRNLAQKTSSEWSNPYTSFSGTANTCPPLYKVLIDDLKVGDTLKSRIVLKYTDIVPASGKTATIHLQGAGNITGWDAGRYDSSPAKPISGSGEMVFEHEFKTTADHLKNDYWNWRFRTDYIARGSLQWKLAKVAKGTVFTGWSPAPEDVENKLNTKADQELTQQQLNMLIEKAQLMQVELEAKVAMETLSDLERAYKAYVEANDKAVAESQADLIEAGRRVDAMVETLGGLSKTKTFIETYIKEANEGIIIATNDNVSQIRVTHDRIAMYSAGKEVMYISQGVIHIDNGIFTKSLQVGRFRTEPHPTNLDINVCRYVG